MDKATLEWAANWILGSLSGEKDERVIEFANNMAMTLRAAALVEAGGVQGDAHVDGVFDGMDCCTVCGLVKPHDGWKKPCNGPAKLSLREVCGARRFGALGPMCYQPSGHRPPHIFECESSEDGPQGDLISREGAEQQRDALSSAIAQAARKAGIYNGDVSLTGPQLVMLCDDLANFALAATEKE